ncbi:hypothetical protein WJX72_008840 [[Myrmecia] bisecta]|uniref:Uncharacterized protein n=1 Tax=[Myrmecia] bisecta TaxID=41462 RepID=A0AAW1P7P5_9CHLO
MHSASVAANGVGPAPGDGAISAEQSLSKQRHQADLVTSVTHAGHASGAHSTAAEIAPPLATLACSPQWSD